MLNPDKSSNNTAEGDPFHFAQLSDLSKDYSHTNSHPNHTDSQPNHTNSQPNHTNSQSNHADSQPNLTRAKSPNIIGANKFLNSHFGGFTPTFSGVFDNNTLINIQGGLGDQVNVVIGDIDDAYDALSHKIENLQDDNFHDICGAVYDVVDEYFGGIENIDQRLDYYPEDEWNIAHNGEKRGKISDLKGSGAAMCTERAALSHNLLKKLGLNSVYISTEILHDGKHEAHCYNLVEDQLGQHYIYDSSIPTVIAGKASPLVAKIPEEVFREMTTDHPDRGYSVETAHYNPIRQKDTTVTYDAGRAKTYHSYND